MRLPKRPAHRRCGLLVAMAVIIAPGYQDGHAAYSDPLDEQQFLIREINALMKPPTALLRTP